MQPGSLALQSINARKRVKDYLASCAQNPGVIGRKGDVREGEIQYITSWEKTLKDEERLTRYARKIDAGYRTNSLAHINNRKELEKQ